MAAAAGRDRSGDPGVDPPVDPDVRPDVSPPDLLRRPVVPTWSDLLERLGPDPGRRVLAAAAVLLLVAGAAVAGYALLRPAEVPPTEVLLPQAGASGGVGAGEGAEAPGTVPVGPSTTAAPVELVVHAAGAVAAPGVHRLPAGSRVADLLAAAGGPAAGADMDRVNLAAALVDGERVWFPRLGEEEPPVVPGTPPTTATSGTGGAAGPAGPVDLNEATAEELDTLPGVGPATAAAIIEHRERQGPFRTVDDLLDVPGIGDAKLAQLRDLVTV